ncbi:hypothetical protein VIH_002601 [Vibrio cholerae CT 5369-93]|uniref:hypothetical protein n=1 Tax=Vibrio mimicus TaxID=674 RepID=UPI0001BAC613|nr:hypothetical protein [Vibrio mimicus]EEY50470.1 hypothetical protein VIH_002601 [Vibrio cholerae CT 5369-93]
MNIAELTPDTLEHNYQRVLKLKANQEAELKKQQQLERLRQSQQSQRIYEYSGVYGDAKPTDGSDSNIVW